MAKYCRSDASYIAVGSYLEDGDNKNIEAGGCFNINILMPPFSFPPPIETLTERGKVTPELAQMLNFQSADLFPTKYLLIYLLDDLCQSDAVIAFVSQFIV